jgi:elongation factor Ts
MGDIPADLVRQLRERTGAGMMDCKRALQETDGDLDEAEKRLREKGITQAAKRSDRETTEGKVAIELGETLAAMVAVGCETEPVSNNEEFQAFATHVLRAVHADGRATVEGFEDERVELVAKLGENIVIVAAERFEAPEGNVLGAYAHPPANKIGALVELQGGTPEFARRLAMHVSFAAPEWAAREDVPSEVVEAERAIFVNSDEVQSKPEAAREKIVDGMLAKRFFAATPGGVLAEQTWIHDAGQTVAKALEAEGASVARFVRISVAGS